MIKRRKKHSLDMSLAILKKVSVGVFLALLIPLLLLSIVYGRMNAAIRSQYYDLCVTNMSGSLRSLEQLFDHLDQIAVYLGDNSDVTRFYNIDRASADKETTAFLRAQQVLGSIGVANSDLENIQLYSARSGVLIDLGTVAFYPERYYGTSFQVDGSGYEAFRVNYLQDDRLLGFSRRQVSGTRFHSPGASLIYQVRHVSSTMRSRNNRALFYLSEDHLLDQFRSMEHFEELRFLVLDREGNILLQRGGEDVSGETMAEIARLNGRKESAGYEQLRTNGVQTFATFCRSEKRGWFCVALLPYSVIVSATGPFRLSMILLSAVALLAGIVLLIVHSMHLAYPAFEVADVLQMGTEKREFSQIAERVRDLARNNEALQEKIDSQVSAVRAEAFIRLLSGESLSEEERLSALTGLGIRTDADHYMILVINANDIRIDTDLEDYGMQRVLLNNFLTEQTELEISEIFPVDIERSVLCLTADGLPMRDFQKGAEQMVTLLRKTMGVDISYSVGGDIVDSASALSSAFLHAQLALKIPNNIFGAHAVQWYERAKQYADLAVESTEAAEDGVSAQNRVLIENIQQFIRENYHDPQLSLRLVGDTFFITEAYLSKLFKKATGINFSRYVDSVRMTRAKELLDGGMKVMDVVGKVGYNSPQVFRRAWKRYFKEDETSTEADG